MLPDGEMMWAWLVKTFYDWLSDYHTGDARSVPEVMKIYTTLMKEAGFGAKAEKKVKGQLANG